MAARETPSKRGIRVIAVALAAATALAYWNSLAGALVYDDHNAIIDNPNVRSLWPVWRAAWSPRDTAVAGRPVVCFTLALNYAVSGLDVWSYHLLNLSIHILAGLTLFGVVRRTLELAALRKHFGRDARLLAAAVTLVWLVHPLQTESVTYISTRTESLMGLFLLLMLYCTIRAATSARPTAWQAAALGACVLGMGSKEVMVGAPVLVLLYDRAFLAGSFRGALRQRTGLYLGLAATWMVLAVLVGLAPRSKSVNFGFGPITPVDYAFTQFGAIMHYLRLALWPQPLVLSYDGWPIAHRPGEVWPQLLVIGVLLAGTLWALWRRPQLGFLGGWFFVILAPSSSVVPITTEIVAERRMYLPLIAIVAVVVLGAWMLLMRLRPMTAAGQRVARGGALLLLVLVVLAASVATMRRNEDYRSERAIWTANLAAWPRGVGANTELARLLYEDGRYQEGIDLLLPIARTQRGGASLRHTLGVGYWHRGELAPASVWLAEAVRMYPDNFAARADYGAVLAQMGQSAEAATQLERAVQLEPNAARPHARLGSLYRSQERLTEAIAHLQAAVQIDPADATARSELGLTFAAQGRLLEAQEQLAESVRLHPSLVDARINLAQVQLQVGEVEQAAEHVKAALHLDPNRAETQYGLGMLRGAQGRTAESIAAYRRALAARPAWPEAANNLAWALATAPDAAQRNPADAVRLAEGVCQRGNAVGPGDLDTLAAAYAAAGRYDDAVRTATHAIALAQQVGQTALAGAMERRLAGYRQGQAYVERAGR